MNPKAPARFAVRVRVPDRGVSALYARTPDANGISSIAVNGRVVAPPIERGYAVIERDWKAGDRIELVLPMKVQRVRASERIAADRGRVALQYGPLVYNIEKADQDIDKALDRSAPLTPEWRKDLLGGVVVIKGAFADGTPLVAIPNFARYNREPAPPPPPPPPPPASVAAGQAGQTGQAAGAPGAQRLSRLPGLRRNRGPHRRRRGRSSGCARPARRSEVPGGGGPPGTAALHGLV